MFIVAGVLALLYSFIMYKCTCLIQSSDCGYTMMFVEDVYIYWIYIAINTIILFFTIGFMSKKNINKIGMSLIIIASTMSIIEYIMWNMGIPILWENTIGDMLWIITLVYALNKVKKKV